MNQAHGCRLAILGAAMAMGMSLSCRGDDATCGDGIIEGDEQCDLDALGGAWCEDVIPHFKGTLSCTSECTFDTTQCLPACGDGILDPDEDCDCGEDASDLPQHCFAVNGADLTNCTAACERIHICGDGVHTIEWCDCGDPSLVASPPAGCPAFNGEENATCTSDCFDDPGEGLCLYDECDPLQGDPPNHGCCDDDYGVWLECKPLIQPGSIPTGVDNVCMRGCDASGDCAWNSFCYNEVEPGMDQCHWSYCGPAEVIDATFHAPCQAPGDELTAGLCIPMGRHLDSHTMYGFCLEPGTIAHGAPCPTPDADPPVSLLDTDRNVGGGVETSMCATGLCLAQTGVSAGICAQFCDWQAEYEALIYGGPASPLACPADSNCWSTSVISLNDITDTPDYGHRGADLAYCRPTEAADSTYGMTTCSLVTGQLLSNPGQTCADTHTDGRCRHETYSVDYYDPVAHAYVTRSEPTLGSLIGLCDHSAPATVTQVWAPCDPANDVCPPGSDCLEEDLFGAATGATRCIPYCDTGHHDGATATCADLGTPATTADGTPTCTSVSYTFGAGGAADPLKSRLGYCALPRP